TPLVGARGAPLPRPPPAPSLPLIAPCLSRTPTPLAINAAGGQESIRRGATVLAPGVAPKPGSAPPVRSAPPHRGEDIHIAPKTSDEPRPARPTRWWTFLIPIGIGVVLAVVTGMWWFLLFSISAPISGYVAYLVEKRRYARDCEQCRHERHAAESEACSRLSELGAAQRRTVFA